MKFNTFFGSVIAFCLMRLACAAQSDYSLIFERHFESQLDVSVDRAEVPVLPPLFSADELCKYPILAGLKAPTKMYEYRLLVRRPNQKDPNVCWTERVAQYGPSDTHDLTILGAYLESTTLLLVYEYSGVTVNVVTIQLTPDGARAQTAPSDAHLRTTFAGDGGRVLSARFEGSLLTHEFRIITTDEAGHEWLFEPTAADGKTGWKPVGLSATQPTTRPRP